MFGRKCIGNTGKKTLLKMKIVQIIFVLIILTIQFVTNMHLLCV